MARVQRRKRTSALLAVLMAVVCSLSLSIPSALAANVTWDVNMPTKEVAVTSPDGAKYVTSVGHRTTDSYADMLGISATTWSIASSGISYKDGDPAANYEMFKKNVFAGIFATDMNEVPNPWGMNLLYNEYAGANGLTPAAYPNYVMMYLNSYDRVGPMNADTTPVDEYGTSRALAMRPDILFGISGGRDVANGYEPLVATINSWTPADEHYVEGDETYSPEYVGFSSMSMHGQAGIMYDLATAAQNAIDKAKAKGITKTTRYEESAMEIAQDYEKYVLASQYYVLAKIADGTLSKKTVGIVRSVDDETTNTIDFLPFGANNAGTNYRAAEALMYTTDNILDVKGYEVGEGGMYAGTADDALACDVIIIQTDNSDGGQGDGVTAAEWVQKLKNVLDKSGKSYEMPDVFVNTPKATCALSRGAADCSMNYGVYLGFVYPEALNPVHMLAYYYEKFYHVKTDALSKVAGALMADMSMPSGVTLSNDLPTYSEAAVQSKLDAGLQYFARNKKAVEALSPDGDLTPFEQMGDIAIVNLDTTELDKLLTTADLMNASTAVGTDASVIDKGEFCASKETHDALAAAIEAAKTAKTNALLQSDIDAAKDALQAAVDTFNAAKIPGAKLEKFTVTFDSAGGTPIQIQIVTEGEQVPQPADPAKTGYTFAGWTLNGSLYDFSAAVTQDMTLVAQWTEVGTQAMYRLYNPYSGEHFYTAEKAEHDNLVGLGWNDEGFGWVAPLQGDEVYRLYNEWGGEHHYTLSADERDALVSAGWSYEGVGWYSDPLKAVKVMREYNPFEVANNHNYTVDQEEHAYLVSIGWNDEGVGWYAVASGK